jgi:hypothetical protein
MSIDKTTMPNTLTPGLRRAVVQDIIRLSKEKYVYPDVGRQIADHIQSKLEQDGYASITDANELAVTLTEDLREVSKDRHWAVMYSPTQQTAYIDPETEEDETQLARWLEQARRTNFGFEKVERLKGNIGYIDLRQFAPAEYAGETAAAAMNFVANCDALIFDLRQNHGGYPSMVQLIISYLINPEPKHINTFYYRPTDDCQQFWTFPYVPGKRMPDTPVYVLTSHGTGSGAEEFAYNLRNMKRATIVGETTVGAAHPVCRETVQEYFQVLLPYGRPINPITDDNWEGKGVEPHIAVPQEGALETAHIHAFEQLIEHCQECEQKRELEWEGEILKSLYTPVAVAESTLSRYAGQYDQRTFALKNGSLMYTHQKHPVTWRLIPITETRFRLDEDLKFEFILDAKGEVSSLVVTYQDGRPEVSVAKTE